MKTLSTYSHSLVVVTPTDLYNDQVFSNKKTLFDLDSRDSMPPPPPSSSPGDKTALSSTSSLYRVGLFVLKLWGVGWWGRNFHTEDCIDG